jgi:uroporphyrinogen III methyltransferase/synthase
MRNLSVASGIKVRVGTRGSRLALIQAEEAISVLLRILPVLRFETVTLSSPGDRDREKDLKTSSSDFFTRDLDRAVLAGELDCAVHSAKDVPDPLPEGIDWFWLPGGYGWRDALVLPRGESVECMPGKARIGASSYRRQAYIYRRFPRAKSYPIRGNIEERLQLVDHGEFDAVIMAGAALLRLGLDDRISEWIPYNDLATPPGQGRLCVTFRSSDSRFTRLRSLSVQPVVFVGAGTGRPSLCTVAGRDELRNCDICFYDALVHPALLEWLPENAEAVGVGKRCGRGGAGQDLICQLLARHSRRGRRVVRLKGGDPGLFGRLAEEIETLNALEMPYRVIPGVSSFNSATTGTGLLPTRRDVTKGFSVLTGRQAGGGTYALDGKSWSQMPMAFLMARRVLAEVVRGMLGNGKEPGTPAAMVFDAGSESEQVVTGTLSNIERKVAKTLQLNESLEERPAILLAGETCRSGFLYRQLGALEGGSVLLTCSKVLMERAVRAVFSYGGWPVPRALIRLVPERSALPVIRNISSYDWLVLTSPSAVDCLVQLMDEAAVGLRQLPRIFGGGPKTAERLRDYHLQLEAAPGPKYGRDIMHNLALETIHPGSKVLRFRSDRADRSFGRLLANGGCEVEDKVLYRNEPVEYDDTPGFDAAFFASDSAVERFVNQWGVETLRDKTVAGIGKPTTDALEKCGIREIVVPDHPTVERAILALAQQKVACSIMEDRK